MRSIHLIAVMLPVVFYFATANASSGSYRSGSSGAKNWYVDLSLAPVFTEKNDSIHGGEGGGGFAGQGVSPSKTLGFDLKSTYGYTFNSMWLVGLSYDIYSTSIKRNSSGVSGGDGAIDGSTSINEFGPTVGAIYNGWHLALTYFLSSTYKYKSRQTDSTTGAVSSDISTTLKDGSGFKLNFGYSIELGSWLEIGPSLIYRQVSYKKESRTDALNLGDPTSTFSDRSFADNAVQGTLSPYLSLTARF